MEHHLCHQDDPYAEPQHHPDGHVHGHDKTEALCHGQGFIVLGLEATTLLIVRLEVMGAVKAVNSRKKL